MKTLRKILAPIAVVWFAALLIAGFLAYFVESVGMNGSTDGLGRPLSETPTVVRFIFGQERMWAGWIWFLLDMLIFWGSVAVTVKVAKRLQQRDKQICAACDSEDHTFHDSDACTNPSSPSPTAGQCECAAVVPAQSKEPCQIAVDTTERFVPSTPKSRTISPQTQRRLESYKKRVVRGRYLRKLREHAKSLNGNGD